MIRNKKRAIFFILISIAVMLITGCSASNNSLTSHAEKEISENDFDLVNAYKRYVGHAELTGEDAKRMQEFPIYPNGKSRWDRVVDFVKAKHTDGKEFNVKRYFAIPENTDDQIDMVNLYYGEIGGGFYDPDLIKEADAAQRALLQDNEKSPWQGELERIFYCMQLLEKKRPEYKSIPSNPLEQYDMLQYYHMELTMAPLEYVAPEKDAEDFELDNLGTKDVLLQYALDEFNGKGFRVQEYKEMPKDLEGQLYMVNALNLQLGMQPLTEKMAELLNAKIEPGVTFWEHMVEGAYAFSNGTLKMQEENTDEGVIFKAFEGYPEHAYYWYEYAKYGDAAFDLSGERITPNF